MMKMRISYSIFLLAMLSFEKVSQMVVGSLCIGRYQNISYSLLLRCSFLGVNLHSYMQYHGDPLLCSGERCHEQTQWYQNILKTIPDMKVIIHFYVIASCAFLYP